MSIEKKLHRRGPANFFVSKPILAIVLNLLIVLAGITAFQSVDVREMPDVNQPVLSVRTTYEGAVPATVDQEVTRVLEDALKGLEGLSYMESSSSSGSSSITIDLSTDTDIDIAANEAREIVSETVRSLPDDIDDPVVSKSDSNSDAIIRLALVGDASLAELSDVAEGLVYEKLTLIDGIAEVNVRGSQSNEFRVELNLPSLLSRGLSVFDVSTALETMRNDTPLGEIMNDVQTLSIQVGNDDVTVEVIEQIPIDEYTRIADVAFVQLTPQDATTYSRVNGQVALGLDITRQSTANTLDISRAVAIAVEDIKRELPDDIELLITSDDGTFIESSLTEVIKTIGLSTLIVIAVILLFLKSLRATLIPAITIPLALTGTLAAIWIAGFSINTISLLALVLATGMVVDDTIVVVENIVRKRQAGMGAFAAAATGTNEVFFAVISTTATLAAVFIPISFLPGQAGGVFAEFGFVLAFAVTISSITALTLAPVLAALLDPSKSMNRGPSSKWVKTLSDTYDWIVYKSIKSPIITIALALACVIFSIGAASNLTSTITPNEDRGFFIIQASGATDASTDYVNTQALLIEAALEPFTASGEIEVVQSLVGIRGSNSALIIVRLPAWSARHRSQQEIAADIQRKLTDIPGTSLRVRSSNSLNIRGGGSGLTFAVTGSDINDMYDSADRLVAAMAENSTFTNPSLSSDSVKPQLEISVDKEMATAMGLTKSEIVNTVGALVQGNVAVSVFTNDNEVDVNLVAGGPPIDDPSDIESLYILLPDDNLAPLSAVAKLSATVSQSQIERQGGALAVSIRSNLAEGIDIGSAIAELNAIADDALLDNTRIVFTGEAATLSDSQTGMYWVFGVALLVVFLVLSAQFESITSAVVIMLTVPFGFAAALMAISFSGGSLNYYSQIGLVLLIGVMAKNGILIVEFANQLREDGQDLHSAARNAMRLRIRPVMMTMVSTILGGLPLILTSGAGAEARIAVGWVIVGGLGLATVFTLGLIPTLYCLIAGLGKNPNAASEQLNKELSQDIESTLNHPIAS